MRRVNIHDVDVADRLLWRKSQASAYDWLNQGSPPALTSSLSFSYFILLYLLYFLLLVYSGKPAKTLQNSIDLTLPSSDSLCRTDTAIKQSNPTLPMSGPERQREPLRYHRTPHNVSG
jgi:hypothetical protein